MQILQVLMGRFEWSIHKPDLMSLANKYPWIINLLPIVVRLKDRSVSRTQQISLKNYDLIASQMACCRMSDQSNRVISSCRKCNPRIVMGLCNCFDVCACLSFGSWCVFLCVCIFYFCFVILLL